eukprot:TRINITY_DN1435_c0_g6_i1.p1 TRINITY_DN1435_c0_g6~~TRINITY_DN1435_c0_g6_i1.p1  ORF type:complete len:1546 (+),score=577.91 TRINITY_DN1435_c0_g6_i1:43-4680(+)
MELRVPITALVMCVGCVLVSGNSGGTPPSSGTGLLPEPTDGNWPAFCKASNIWEPTKTTVTDHCPSLSLADCHSGCSWDIVGKKCINAGCPHKPHNECEMYDACVWNEGTNVCETKPPPPKCEEKLTEKVCFEARSKGCTWVHDKCMECAAMNQTYCSTLSGECVWEHHERCIASGMHPGCQGKTVTECGALSDCEYNATSAECIPIGCSTLLTEASCTTLPTCMWSMGTCAVGDLNCTIHTAMDSCNVYTDCYWEEKSICKNPECQKIASESLCVNGCEWKIDRCEATGALDCKTLVETDCLLKSQFGCSWKDEGCHQKNDAYISECTGLEITSCEALPACKWEETKSSCATAECAKLSRDECIAKESCSYDEHTASCSSVELQHTADHGEHPPPYNILVIFVIGALGAFFRHNFSDSRLPYTVILFMAGAAFDGLAQLVTTLDKFVGLADINPHLLFYIFLPVLIFESAFAVDWFVFKTVIWHCILLAGPGICVASFLTAVVAKYVFTAYDWSWEATLLFGVTLSATDPVAVVALLKELGASPQISTLIEGESLLNDGTAIVFFTILQAAVAGCSGHVEDSAGVLIGELFKVALGGPFLGYIMGVISITCLSYVFNDPLIEITTSLVTAYVTFFVAEAYFHVSGVLAVVACGIYMSHRKQAISPEVHHTLHEFWEMSVYLGNTLIFTMAGMIVAGKAFAHVKFEDFVYLLVTYVAINVIRMFVVMLFSLIYNRFDYKLDTGMMVLVAWGGLRGAVGLALSLIVAGDHRLSMRDPSDPRTILQTKLVFFVAGIVVLTLLVNGVTTADVVKKFKLDQVSDIKKRMMKENFKRLKEGGMDQLEDLKTESALYDVNWLEAKKWVFEDMSDPYNNEDEFLGEGDPHSEAIMHYFKIMHSSVWDQNEEGLLDGDAVRFLLAKINEREKLAKKKQLEGDTGVFLQTSDSYIAMTMASPTSPISAKEMQSFDRIQVIINYVSKGRDIKLVMDSHGNVLKLKQKIYNEENIPIDQQRISLASSGRILDDIELLSTLHVPGRPCEVSLNRLNPDEDILLNASILEQFWEFDEGLYGQFEEVMDRVYKLGAQVSYREAKWTYGFNVAMALVIAHDAVLAKIDNIADPGEANKLKTHAKQVKREVLQQLVAFASKASQTSIAMKTTLAARTVLNHARMKIWDWQKEGLIEDKEAEVLVSLVEKKMKELTRVGAKMQACSPDYILSQMEWYTAGSNEIKDYLKSKRKLRKFQRGQLLIEKGDEHSNIILITAGSARVHVNRRFDYVGPGYAAGLLSSLTGTTKYCDIYAETDLQALTFKSEGILNLISKKGNEAFAQALWRAAGVDLAYKLLRGKEPYSKWAPREVRKFVNKGKLLDLPRYRPEDKRVQLGHGCYHVLISGKMRDATNQGKDAKMTDLEVVHAPCLIPVDCHEAYLQTHTWQMETTVEDESQWFGTGKGEVREDEVHVIVVEDPSSASARARKYWEKIYKKIRSIKTTAALRGADVKTALAEAFGSDMTLASPIQRPSYTFLQSPLSGETVPAVGGNAAAPLLANA